VRALIAGRSQVLAIMIIAVVLCLPTLADAHLKQPSNTTRNTSIDGEVGLIVNVPKDRFHVGEAIALKLALKAWSMKSSNSFQVVSRTIMLRSNRLEELAKKLEKSKD
jgi:hypothetical protein